MAAMHTAKDFPVLGTSRRRGAIIVLCASYLAAGALWLIYSGVQLRYPDEEQYLDMARYLLAHGMISSDGVHPTAYRTPGYPVLIAALWWLWPSILAVKAAQLIVWAATGLLLARLANRFYGFLAGYLSALAFLLYLPQLYIAPILYPQVVVGFLFVSLLLMVTGSPRLGLGRLLAFVVAAVSAIMMVPNFAPAVVALGAYAVIDGRASLKGIAVVIATVVLVCLAWSLRNGLVIGDFTFSTNFGQNLLLGNNDNATAGSGNLVSFDGIIAAPPTRLSEAEENRAMAQLAFAWIGNHPTRAFVLLLEKFVNWFAPSNNFVTRTGLTAGLLPALATGVVYYPILILSGLEVFSARGRARRFAGGVWTSYLLVALSYAVFFTRVRHRLPFDIPLIALACGYVAMVLRGRLATRPGVPEVTPMSVVPGPR